ncbi:MAG: AMP-binding protein [Bacteroidales bacterium]|nr:AMP-binding protein [Bacteroidales bacterium]
MGFTIAIRDKIIHEAEIKEYILSAPDKVLSHWESDIFSFIREWYSDNDDVELRTSGSTGKPSFLRVKKNIMAESAQRTLQFFRLEPGDKALLCLPAGFIAGKMMILRAIVGELRLMATEPSGNPLRNISGEFDFAAMIPMQVYNILNESDGINKLNNIRNLIIGGGIIDSELREKTSKLANKVYETYGMTETLTHVALKKLNEPGKQKYFRALQGISFSREENGCLAIHAPYISPKKIITNDIAVLHNPHEFEYAGRLDNIINSGGIKISPEDIEGRLKPFIHGEFIIAGFPDPKLGEKLVLILEEQSLQTLKTPDIPGSLLKSFEKPGKIIAVKSFERTASGKIIRKKVMEEALKSYRQL